MFAIFVASVGLDGPNLTGLQCTLCPRHVHLRPLPVSLQVLDNGRRLHLADAANATKQIFTGFAKNISTAFMLPIQSLQNAFKPSPPAPTDGAERQAARVERQPQGTSLEAGPLPAGATVTVSVRSAPTGDHEVSQIEDRMAGALCMAYTSSGPVSASMMLLCWKSPALTLPCIHPLTHSSV